MPPSLSKDKAKSRFDAALQEHNFGHRCHILAQLGKDIKTVGLPSADLEVFLDSLLPGAAQAEEPGPLDAFAEKARLLVAKAAGCLSYPKKLLDHPSQTVRFSAVRDGLLQPDDAREAFLSDTSSRKLKKLLVKCEALPSDKNVLEHAWQLFGSKDKELFWMVLARAESELLLDDYLAEGKDMQEWLSERHKDKVPGLPQLARRFPNYMVKLVADGTLLWRWYWVMEILEKDSWLVLRATMVEGHDSGSGPKHGYAPDAKNQKFCQTLANWGWRRKPELMLDICQELTARSSGDEPGRNGKGKGKGRDAADGDFGFCGIPQVQLLAEYLMNSTSTRYSLTMKQKISLLMRIWSVLPDSHKSARVALIFASLLPGFFCEEHRSTEIQSVIDAFWRILTEVGRSTRQELLVGPDKQPTECAAFLHTFAAKIPPPLAVAQFFKVLDEFEAGTKAYQYIQSIICKSVNGRHDELMQCVFARYLLKPEEGPVKAAEMFQVLLKDARSRDVIQASLDLLVQHLDGHCELGLLSTVVTRMGLLERESRQEGKEELTPDAALPMPTGWLRLIVLPETAPPHADFLLHVLHTGTATTDLLGGMIVKYGPSFFWDTLAHVLLSALDKLLKQAPPAPALQVLKDINVSAVAAAGVTKTSATTSKVSAVSCLGSQIIGVDGEVWGRVVAEEGKAWKLEGGRIAKKETEGVKWRWAAGQGVHATDASKASYSSLAADLKKKVNVKDANVRNSGYSELMATANKDKEQSAAFEDLLPYLLSRFNAEQEPGRTHILTELLSVHLPEKLREEKLEHLQMLWKVCSKARESSSYTCVWKKFGTQLVEKALKTWSDESVGPSEACLFGLEVAPGLNIPELFAKCHKDLKTPSALESSFRWVLQTSVPLANDTGNSLADFWTALQVMANVQFCGKRENTVSSWTVVSKGRGGEGVQVHQDKSTTSAQIGSKKAGTAVRCVQERSWLRLIDEPGFILVVSESTGVATMQRASGTSAEKGLWETFSSVGDWWRALLAQGVKQKAAEFVFIGILELLAGRQTQYCNEAIKQRWWEPLESAEYQAAVAAVLELMESGEIPAKEASAMLARRIAALKDIEIMTRTDWKVRVTKRRERVEATAATILAKQQALTQIGFRELPAMEWLAEQKWDIPKHHSYTPLPWQSFRCRDSIASSELSTLNKLLARSQSREQSNPVLWKVAEVAAMLSGPNVLKLIEQAIAILDPRFEGMARSIGRHYPYLNSALTKGEKLDGSSDVLTPLLELWLLDDSTRDSCVEKLMQRGNCELFFFFGTSFARHLSTVRQEWLHKCMSKLLAFSSEEGRVEFYHYNRRGPGLIQVARFGRAKPGWRDVISSPGKTVKSGALQMYLWHPNTQSDFLKKALLSTERGTLEIIPRLEYADGIARVSDLLGSYPKEQSIKNVEVDVWGWEVIQAAGAYSDIKTEVERRFQDLSRPWVCDVVDDGEVETLLSALGHADNAGASMKVLGLYAGKVKQAKEAVTKMISQLSPPQARGLIRDIMLPKKAGLGLQVAGLKKIVELGIPEPLELYRMAWRQGKCHRDVAANILSKVATSPEFAADDVRSFFEFFDRADRQDDRAVVAELLLDQLIESPEWVLPFLPKVVGKLATLSGTTQKAVQALKKSTSNVTAVVESLTGVIQGARLALRAEPKGSKDGSEGKLLSDLAGLMSYSSINDLASHVARMQLKDCESGVLKAFVAELLRRWHDAVLDCDAYAKSLLDCALAVWVKLLRAGEASIWSAILLEMEQRLIEQGTALSLGAMAKVVASHVPALGLGPEDWDKMLAALRTCFDRLLSGPLAVTAVSGSFVADEAFLEENRQRGKVQEELLLKHWVGILAHGCEEVESDCLFARCPEKSRLQLATAVVEAAVQSIQEAEKTKQKKAKVFQQSRPTEGWQHKGGMPLEQIELGSEVSGTVTNSSQACGVFVNFGCEKDGKLDVPVADWRKFRVGDRIERMIVNLVNVKKVFVNLLLVSSRECSVAAAASKEVSRRALRWLSSSSDLRDTHLNTLTKLWAMVVALETTGDSFEANLPLMGPLSTKASVGLVEQLLKLQPQKELARAALTWLSKGSPAEAVRLWASLLTPNKGSECVEAADMKALLDLCEAHGLEPQKFSKVVANGLSEQVLAMLCSSRLPEARLGSIQALRERHVSGEPPRALAKLCEDSCEVVRSAARDLWSALGGKDESWQLKKTEDEDEEDDEDQR